MLCSVRLSMTLDTYETLSTIGGATLRKPGVAVAGSGPKGTGWAV